MMRYIGQGHEIRVSLPVRKLRPKDARVLHELFEEHYHAHFNRVIPDGAVEVMNWSLSVSTLPPEPVAARRPRPLKPPKPKSYRAMLEPETGSFRKIPVYWRFDLKPGTRIRGPAVIAENETSTVVTGAFDAAINSLGYIVLERRAPAKPSR
jgi:N-methylhydantoinase A